MPFKTQYGPWAVITGGSEGVGAGFAHELAAKGLNLVLTARTASKLEALAKEIRAAHPACEIRTLAGNLGQPEGAAAIIEATKELEVGLLICNAGAASHWKHFLEDDLSTATHLVNLNINSTLALVHHFGKLMKARQRGGILLMGSIAATAGAPGFAIYSAAKSFIATFAEGLWYELKSSNVKVLGYIIGSTDTPSVARSFPGAIGSGADAKATALHGLAELENGPVAYFGEGGMAAQMIKNMPRAEAIEMIYQGGALYR